jgi:hypothetical protein
MVGNYKMKGHGHCIQQKTFQGFFLPVKEQVAYNGIVYCEGRNVDPENIQVLFSSFIRSSIRFRRFLTPVLKSVKESETNQGEQENFHFRDPFPANYCGFIHFFLYFIEFRKGGKKNIGHRYTACDREPFTARYTGETQFLSINMGETKDQNRNERIEDHENYFTSEDKKSRSNLFSRKF